jgi:hypothetical protein
MGLVFHLGIDVIGCTEQYWVGALQKDGVGSVKALPVSRGAMRSTPATTAA